MRIGDSITTGVVTAVALGIPVFFALCWWPLWLVIWRYWFG